jgi:hypothetical protein
VVVGDLTTSAISQFTVLVALPVLIQVAEHFSSFPALPEAQRLLRLMDYPIFTGHLRVVERRAIPALWFSVSLWINHDHYYVER